MALIQLMFLGKNRFLALLRIHFTLFMLANIIVNNARKHNILLYIYFQFVFGLLAFFRLLSMINFATYDTKCMIFERASVIDCHQDGLFPDTESWILAWIILSITSSIIFLYILYIANKLELLETFSNEMMRLKSSFASFTILSLLAIVFYVLRIVSKGLNGISGATSFFLLIWPIVMWFVVWILNYTQQVCFKSCCSRRTSPIGLFYWFALVMYFVETVFKVFSVMLDVAYDVAPAIEGQFSDESLKGIIVILSGFRLAYHTRLLRFFWNKMFHGDTDLFSGPFTKLIEYKTRQTKQTV